MRIVFTHNLQTSPDEEQAEFDSPATVAAITTALESLGHTVIPVAVNGAVHGWLSRVEAAKPDLIFNTAEGNHGRFREASFPAIFDMLGIPYTGSDAYVCGVSLDKRLTKLMAERLGIRTPRWLFMTSPLDAIPEDFPFPALLKPNFEGSSKGITAASVVEDIGAAQRLATELLPRFGHGLLLEQFVAGRDVVVPWLEGASAQTHGVLAPAGYRFANNAAGPHAVYGFNLKNVDSSPVQVESPVNVPEGTRKLLMDGSLQLIRALGAADLCRLDWRLDAEQQPWFLELNALPGLESGATMFESARHAGLNSVAAVLGCVVESAMKRYGLDAAKPRKGGKRVGLIYNLKRAKAQVDGSNDHDAEFDSQATVDAIRLALESLDHEVVPLEASGEILTRLGPAGIDVAFNIAEGIRGRSRESLVPSLLETLDIPYTGSDPATMAVTLDKALAKRVVKQAGVRTADFLVMFTGDEALPKGFPFPAVVKPVAEGSSKGVHGTGVVHDETQLRQAARAIISRYQQAALVESFLPGREFTVAILSWPAPTVLPPMEIVFTEKAEPFPVYSFKHKQDFSEEVRYDTTGTNLTPKLRHELEQTALKAFQALGCRDVSRVDLRLDAKGRVAFIECNPLPGLTPEWSDLCLIAKGVGISYQELIRRILQPALERLERQRHDATKAAEA